MPNKPDAPNPAMTPQLHSRAVWRGVGDPDRWAMKIILRFCSAIGLMVVFTATGCHQDSRSGLALVEVAGRPLEVRTASGNINIGGVRSASQIAPEFIEFRILQTPSGWRLAGVTQDKGDKMIEFTSKGEPVHVAVVASAGVPTGSTIKLQILP